MQEKHSSISSFATSMSLIFLSCGTSQDFQCDSEKLWWDRTSFSCFWSEREYFKFLTNKYDVNSRVFVAIVYQVDEIILYS